MAAASLFILFPLRIARRQAKSVAREALNISVYRDQFTELEADHGNGILSTEQYEAAKLELQRRLLKDVEQAKKEVPVGDADKSFSEGVRIAVMVAIAVPVSAVLVYMQLGNSKALMAQQGMREPVTTASNRQIEVAGQLTPERLQSSVEQLSAHLKDQPADAGGWAKLGQTYAAMARFKEASAAYARSTVLLPDNPSVLADYAEVLGMMNNGQLAGKPSDLINRALRLDSGHPKALALAGIAAFEEKRFKQAADYWEQLYAILPENSEVISSVAKSIDEAKSMAASENITDSGQVGSKGMPAEKNGAAPPPNTTLPSSGATLGEISGRVTLAPALLAKTSPDDTLFIFARAKVGPKMPLAILRLQAKNLPATFSLNDTMAMSPAMKLSDFPEVIVGARLSKSGNAMPQSGDLQGFSQSVRIGNQAVLVVIDQQVP